VIVVATEVAAVADADDANESAKPARLLTKEYDSWATRNGVPVGCDGFPVGAADSVVVMDSTYRDGKFRHFERVSNWT
jgi:hypothetical protein